MKPDTFKTLLQIIGHNEKRTTNFRRPLSARERLVITFVYLATCEHKKPGVNLIKFYVRSKTLSIQKTCWLDALSLTRANCLH